MELKQGLSLEALAFLTELSVDEVASIIRDLEKN
jgi:hypothetical protein